MIIDAKKSEVELIGDIQEFKAGIDPKNLDFITTLLSSNLYSEPENSFIREIVSNAWDSHVEAGTTDTPVLIDIKSDSVTIRDFGTGLSPERFKEVYCNIASSTKRESNDYIGAFGIGKMAPLAVSNMVYITSYYEGKAYYYVMVKDGNSITYNRINVTDTTERNGVEVSVRNLLKSTMDKIEGALEYMIFFPNIYVQGGTWRSDHINNIKIKNFNTYAVASESIPHKILLGKVLYPLNVGSLGNIPYEMKLFVQKIKYTGVVIKFDIGELEVTPNRENIIYTQSTINLILEKLVAAREELENNLIKAVAKDYTNIREYIKTVTSIFNVNCYTEKIDNRESYLLTSTASIDKGITYLGNSYSRLVLEKLNSVFSMTHLTLKACVQDKVYSNTSSAPSKLYSQKKLNYSNVIIVPKDTRLVSSLKSYLVENFDGWNVIADFTYSEFESYVFSDVYGADEFKTNLDFKYLLEEIYKWIYKIGVKKDFNTDTDYLSYKESIKKTPVKSTLKNIHIYTYEYKYSTIDKKTKVFSNFDDVITYIKEIKSAVVYDNISKDNKDIVGTITSIHPKYIYITAAKSVINEIAKLSLTNLLTVDEVLYKDETIKKLALLQKYHLLNIQKSIVSFMPKNIGIKFKEICKFTDKYRYNQLPINHLARFTEEDTTLELLSDIYYKYNNIISMIESSYGIGRDTSLGEDIITLVIMKNKMRVGYSRYNDLKSNELIKMICQK